MSEQKEYINASQAYRILIACGIQISQPTFNLRIRKHPEVAIQPTGDYGTIMVDKEAFLKLLQSGHLDFQVNQAKLNAWIRNDRQGKEEVA